MSSLPNGLTFQVILTPPTGGNVSALRQQIQAGLGNIQANVQLNNAATANKQLNAISASTKKSTKDTKAFGDAIGIAGRNFAAYTSAVAILGRISIALSRATRDAIKFEREFVKLAQVFDTNVKNLEGLSNKISELSQQYGLSANVIAKTSVVLAQSGLTARETQIALNSLAKTTLASTFDNIAQTAEGAVAIIAQFEEGVGSLESQLGAINAVSKKFAVESSDIIEAVRRGGGAFKAANGTFNEFISLFTAVRSTTRESAETISTGFRTIFARLQRPKVIDYFKELNIQLEDGQGNFVGAFEAVKRLSEGLDRAGIKAGQIKFAEVVEQLGGIRQVSRVIPLLGQFKKAEEARQVALAGGVSLDKDAAKAQETTAQAIERTRQNFAALIREISQTQSFKEIVKIALSMANAFLEIARTLKPLIPLIAVLGSIKLGGLFSTAVKTGFTTPGLGTKRPFAKGGTVLGFNRGGSVPGTGNGDTVPAMLEPGEFVIRKSAVQAFGAENLAGINKYAGGGEFKKLPPSKDTEFTHLDKLNTSASARRWAEKQGMGNIRQLYSSVGVDLPKNWNRDWDRKNKQGTTSTRLKNYIERKGGSIFNSLLNSGNIAHLTGGKSNPAVIELKKKKVSIARSFAEKITPRRNLDTDQDVISSDIAEALMDAFGGKRSVLGKATRRVSAVRFEDGDGKARSRQRANLQLSKAAGFYSRMERKAKGGAVGTDTVPALLTPGEFVINKKSAEAYGYGNLKKINKYAKGGPVGVQKFADGGEVGGFAGFDFITSAAAEFGILFFSLKQISGSLKQFQDGLSKSGGAIKKDIEARELLRLKIAAAKEGFETLDLQKYQDSVDAAAANLLTAKNRAFSDPSTGIQRDAVDSAMVAVSSTFGAGAATRSDEENARSAVRLDTAIDSLSKKYGESGAVVEGLKNVINQYSGDLLAQSNAAKAYVESLEAANSQIEELTNAEKLAVNQSSKILRQKQKYQQELLSEIAELEKGTGSGDLKKSIKNFGSSIVAAGSKLKKIALIRIPGPGALAAGAGRGIVSGTKAVGARIGAGARVGVEKVKSVASKIDPLAATAAIAASLDSILSQIIGSFGNLAESAAQNGDVQEAALAARQESEAKLNKTIILGATATGAAIGSIVPVVGTAIGAGVGAIAGTLATYSSSLKTSLYDGAISFANMTGFFGQTETYSEQLAKNEKKRVEQAKTTNIQKALDGIGVQFRNASRDLDPKTNFAGFASEANKLAQATKAQKDAALQLSKDAPNRAEIIAQSDQQVKDAFDQLAEAANAQGISLEKVAQDYPELVEAFKATLPPGEVESMWKQRIQASQASIAAIASENAAKQRSISIFLEQIAIQERLNASLAAFDQSLKGQEQVIAGLDFALTGNVAIPQVGTSLTDFSQAGTAEFNQGLAEVAKISPEFAKQARRVKVGLGGFQNFAETLVQDPKKASQDIKKRLSGVLSDDQIDKIQEKITNFTKENGDGQAAAALEEALIKEFVGPFADTLEEGRSRINKSVENYNTILEKRNELERQGLQRRLDIAKQEQDIQKQIREISGIELTAGQARRGSIDLAKTALGGTNFSQSLTGNRAADVAFLGEQLKTNRNAEKLFQERLSSEVLTPDEINSTNEALKGLQFESEKLEKAMEFLSDSTEETAVLQKKLEQSRAERAAKREVATSLAFGTNESRRKFFSDFRASQISGATGSAEVIPENQRSDVLGLFKQFSNARLFGGRTGREAERAATGNYLASLGLSFDEINNVMDDFIAGELDMIGAIKENLRVDVDRNKILLSIQQNLAAPNPNQPNALQFPANGGIIHASQGQLINFTPKGTDTVPAMLTPGEFVIKRSSVRKYGNKMMESINAGNFAGGGQIGDSIQTITKPQFFPVDFVKEKYQDYLSVPRNAGREKYPGSNFWPPSITWAEGFRQLTGTRSEKQAKYIREINSVYNNSFAKTYSKLLELGIGLKQNVGPNGEDQFGPGIVKGATIKNGVTVFEKENRIVPSEDLVRFGIIIKAMLSTLQNNSDLNLTNRIRDPLVYKNIDKIFGGRLTQDLTGLLEAYREIEAAFLALNNNDPLKEAFVDSRKEVRNRRRGRGAGTPAQLRRQREEELRKIGLFNAGGPVYASTGKLVNYQPKGTDTVPAMLTPGEFVINKSSVDKYGAGMLSAINAGNYATGGAVKPKYLRNGGFFETEEEAEKRIMKDNPNLLYLASKSVLDEGPYGEKPLDIGPVAEGKEAKANRIANETPQQRADGGTISGTISGRFGRTRRLDPVRNTQLVSSEENTTPKKSRLDESNSILEKFNKALSELSETSKALAAAKAAEASATDQRLSDFTEEALARGDYNAALKYATEQSKALWAQEEKASREAKQRFAKEFAEASGRFSAGDPRLKALTADEAGINLLKTIVKHDRDLANRNTRARFGRVGEKSEIEKESLDSILARAKAKSKRDSGKVTNLAPTNRRDLGSSSNRAGVSGVVNQRRGVSGVVNQRRGVVDELSRGIPKQLPKAPTSLREDAEAKRKARVASRLGAETGVTYGTGTSQTGVTYGTGPSRAAKFGPVTREEEAAFQEQKAIAEQKRAITTAELKATGGDFQMRNVGTENSPRYEEAFLGFKGPYAEEDRKLFAQKSFEAAVAGGYGFANTKGLMNLKKKSEIAQSKASREEELLNYMKKNPKLSRKRASARLSRFYTGGLVSGIPGIDTNPAMLTRGEYVINKKSAEAIGINNLNRLNSARGYNKGGKVGYYADGGSVGGLGNSSESYTMFSNSVDKLVGNNGFAMFKESVDQFNSIPKELTLTVAPTQVTVTLNGAELLSRMTPMIKSQIFEGITSEINKLKEDLKSGNIV